jgi:hypothetical protein
MRSTEFASQLRDQQQGKFQMSRIGWSGRIDPDGNIHQFVTSKGNQNDGRYSNAEVDKLLDEARTLYDVAERKKRYDAAQKILQDELPIVYLYNQTVFFALRSNLQGFVINPRRDDQALGAEALVTPTRPSIEALPFPLAGKGEGWGAARSASVARQEAPASFGSPGQLVHRSCFSPPTPNPSPQGGGEIGQGTSCSR